MNRSENMRRIRSKDSSPEMTVRRLLHKLGYRYRLHRHDLPGRPDIIFPGRRKIIFVHGCFWHVHTGCKRSHAPKSNKAYWVPKLRRNRLRDKRNHSSLKALGWKSLVLWECQIGDAQRLNIRVRTFLDRASGSRKTRPRRT